MKASGTGREGGEYSFEVSSPRSRTCVYPWAAIISPLGRGRARAERPPEAASSAGVQTQSEESGPAANGRARCQAQRATRENRHGQSRSGCQDHPRTLAVPVRAARPAPRLPPAGDRRAPRDRPALPRTGVDTIVVFDTHWLVNAGYHINCAPHFEGLYTSNELPHFIANMEYGFPGNPEWAASSPRAATRSAWRPWPTTPPPSARSTAPWYRCAT